MIPSRVSRQICAAQIGDVEQIATGYRRWVNEHPEQVDDAL